MKKSIILIFLIGFMSSEMAFSQNNNDSLAKENMIMKIRKPKKYPSFYLSVSYLNWQGMPSNVEYNPNNNREFSMYKLFNLFRYSNHFNAALGVSASMMTMLIIIVAKILPVVSF